MRFKEAYNKCLKEVGEIEEYYKKLFEVYESKDSKLKSIEKNFNRIYESTYEHAKKKLDDIPYLNNTLYGMNGIILGEGRMTDKMNMINSY